jgi:hypothetical protein
MTSEYELIIPDDECIDEIIEGVLVEDDKDEKEMERAVKDSQRFVKSHLAFHCPTCGSEMNGRKTYLLKIENGNVDFRLCSLFCAVVTQKRYCRRGTASSITTNQQ